MFSSVPGAAIMFPQKNIFSGSCHVARIMRAGMQDMGEWSGVNITEKWKGDCWRHLVLNQCNREAIYLWLWDILCEDVRVVI